MIDLVLYRARIGSFKNHCRRKKVPINRYCRKNLQGKSGKCLLPIIRIFLKICLIVGFLTCWYSQVDTIELEGAHVDGPVGDGDPCSRAGEARLVAVHVGAPAAGNDGPYSRGEARPAAVLLQGSVWFNQYSESGKKSNPNFIARYTYGNKQNSRGIKNIHLNIRSLGQKLSDVKNIVREQNPHIFGLSECELRKVNNSFDEKKLKIPGYNLLFPKSWSRYGIARVVVYVKKTLRYEQVPDLENDDIQSVWLRGGFKNCKDIYFCHMYREHTTTLGSSLASQRNSLRNLLHQWEEASTYNNNVAINEVHVSGDMNLDILDGKWLRPSYNLITLSKMVQGTCNAVNLTQLVTVPTRYQFNSVKQSMDYSCIDHVNTNTRFR